MRPATALCLFLAFVVVAALSIYWYRGPLAPPPPSEDLARYEHGRADLERLAAAAKRYRQETGSPPRTLSDLAPRYVDTVPKDPWGRPYLYQLRGKEAQLSFLGRDGETGPVTQAVDRDLVIFVRP